MSYSARWNDEYILGVDPSGEFPRTIKQTRRIDVGTEPGCEWTGDHEFRGTGACVHCGLRFRCVCGRFMRTSDLKHHILRCPVGPAKEGVRA